MGSLSPCSSLGVQRAAQPWECDCALPLAGARGMSGLETLSCATTSRLQGPAFRCLSLLCSARTSENIYLFSVINTRIFGSNMVNSIKLGEGRQGNRKKFKHLFLKLQHAFQPPFGPCVPEEEPQHRRLCSYLYREKCQQCLWRLYHGVSHCSYLV